MTSPVIAVHTIVKNEAEHLKRWAEAAERC